MKSSILKMPIARNYVTMPIARIMKKMKSRILKMPIARKPEHTEEN